MTLTEARAALSAHDAAYAQVQAHNQALRVYHAAKPTPPKGERPQRPAVDCPSNEQLDAAQRTQADARRSEGAQAAHAAQLARAKDDLATAEARLKATAVEAARVVRLAAACRRAPGEESTKQLAALGDMEGVLVTFAGEDRGARDPYVTVTYQGIPFEALSGGQKVLADLLLRRGLRLANGTPALPLAVDDCIQLNAGAGPWPEVPGSSIWMMTTDAAGGAK